MPGPWERYQQAPGPWSRYQQPQAEGPSDPYAGLLGGSEATMGAPKEQDFWTKAQGALMAALKAGGSAAAGPFSLVRHAGRNLAPESFSGDPDRAELEAAGVATQPTLGRLVDTAEAGAAAMAGGEGMAGAVAGAGAAGRALRQVNPRQAAGVLADVIENPRGLVTKPLRRYAEGAAKGAAPAEAAAAEAAGGSVTPFPGPKAAPSAAAAQAEEVSAKIMALRQQGLSGAQITSSLRQLYGIPPSDGQKMVDMVLRANLLRGVP